MSTESVHKYKVAIFRYTERYVRDGDGMKRLPVEGKGLTAQIQQFLDQTGAIPSFLSPPSVAWFQIPGEQTYIMATGVSMIYVQPEPSHPEGTSQETEPLQIQKQVVQQIDLVGLIKDAVRAAIQKTSGNPSTGGSP